MRTIFRLRVSPLPLLAALLLASCAAPPQPLTELERLQARAERVTIIRDDYGVPHIYAKTDADAVFGLLYAQSEDDFPRVERNYVWAIGRLAEVKGEAAIWSDLRARLYMTEAEARAAYADAPGWLRELCDAFADGVNYYLLTHPEVEPELLTRFEPWMPMYFFEGSIGGDIEQIPLDGIEAFYGRGAAVAAAPAPVDRREPRGSNGFAIAGKLTASGDTLLLINPHTSFFFRGEVHVVSEEGLNAYGAVTWGQFFVYQGFNEDTGWMHTSTYVDFIDEFVEDIVETEDGLFYRYGDELRPVWSENVTLRYRDGDSFAERTFPLFRTHHGPVTHRLGDRWVATKINWKPADALAQSFIRTKQTDHASFRQMMERRTNSSNNTVFADSSGNIAYYHGNFVPRRDPSIDYSQPVDGSDPATDWQGLHDVSETITVFNPPNGWIQNANSTPFTAAGEFSPRREDYPRYMAPDAETFRGIQAVRLLSEVSDLTLDGLIELAYDPYLVGFEVLIPPLIDAYDRAPDAPAALAGPIDTLRAWDYRVALDSEAMTLAHFYAARLRDEGERPPGLSRIDTFRYFAERSPDAERLAVFGRVVDRLVADFGDWAVPWGDVNRYQRLTGDIEQTFDDAAPSVPIGMASSRWGALASFGAEPSPDTKRIYGRAGNSFVAVVQFGDRVRAKSLLAGGQSGDPASPHFDDQVPLYADGEFKDVAYYREDVAARAAETYHPGQR